MRSSNDGRAPASVSSKFSRLNVATRTDAIAPPLSHRVNARPHWVAGDRTVQLGRPIPPVTPDQHEDDAPSLGEPQGITLADRVRVSAVLLGRSGTRHLFR